MKGVFDRNPGCAFPIVDIEQLRHPRPMSPHATSSLLPVPTGWQALHYAILSDDTLAVAATDVDLATEWKRILGSHGQVEPPSLINQLTNSGRGHVMTWGADGWQDGPMFPLETPHPLIDRFTDGRWLVVASRTGNEPNARVLTSTGSLLDRIMLGDGIEHITIDDRDRIWVGWFDEGIFGEGWSVPGMESSPSSNGVGCFMPDGTVTDVPSWPKEAGVIADCYVLAHNGSGVWTSPYADFPLVHFVPGMPTRWWRSELVGPQAIAVDGQYALVAGGDRGDAARMALIELNGSGNGEEITLFGKWRMPLRSAPPPQNEWAAVWETPDLLTGRGDTIHLIDDGKWHLWRVADAVASLDRP